MAELVPTLSAHPIWGFFDTGVGTLMHVTRTLPAPLGLLTALVSRPVPTDGPDGHSALYPKPLRGSTLLYGGVLGCHTALRLRECQRLGVCDDSTSGKCFPQRLLRQSMRHPATLAPDGPVRATFIADAIYRLKRNPLERWHSRSLKECLGQSIHLQSTRSRSSTQQDASRLSFLSGLKAGVSRKATQ
jgi:hypothetical protein